MALISSAERMDEHLLPYIKAMQTMYPDKLLVRGRLCTMAADLLSVTRQAVSARIVDAVAKEKLIEIFPRADWLVTLPEGDDLPHLFAVGNPDMRVAYDLLPKAPTSRGAGGVSFLVTPEGLKRLLSLTRERLALPEPDGMEFYKPVIERRLRPDDYYRLTRIMTVKYPGMANGAQPEDILGDLLSVLRLKPPQRP